MELKRIISEHITENRRPTPQFRCDIVQTKVNRICVGAPEVFPYIKQLYPLKISANQEEMKHNLQNVFFSNTIFLCIFRN